MTNQRLSDGPSSDGLDQMIQSIESDAIRKQVEKVPDRRIQHFLATRCKQDVATSTVANDCSRLLWYCRFIEYRGVELEQVDCGDVRAYFQQTAKHSRSLDTLECYRVVIRKLHAHLWREFNITSVRPTEIRDIDMAAVRNSVAFHGIHPSEIHRLYRTAESTRDALMIRTAHEAGLTSEELRSLTLSDFHRQKRVLSVPTQDSTRSIPLLDSLVSDIIAWIEEGHPDPTNPDSPLFPSPDCSHIKSHFAFYSTFREVVDRARLRSPNSPKHRTDQRRLSPKALWKSGRDHWRLDGVPEEVCKYLEKPQGSGGQQLSVSKQRAFEQFRENFEPRS